jgi:CheY-like chemotaxis protein
MARDGAIAIRPVHTCSPEVQLLALGLPGIFGYDLARAVRGDESCAGALLVTLTGWGSIDDKRKSKAAGFDVHLTKPVNLDGPEALLTDGQSDGDS